MQITRTFTHRAYGPIATATLAHGNAGWALDESRCHRHPSNIF